MNEPRALSAPNQALQTSWYGYDIEPPEQSAVPLAHYLWILRRQRWKILSFVFACVTAVTIISVRLTPIFESTVTVDIDRQMPSAIIGQDAARSPLNDADQFLATQVKLIQSDSVLTARRAAVSPAGCGEGGSRRYAGAADGSRERGAHFAAEAKGDAASQYLSAADQLPLTPVRVWPRM